MIKPHTKKINRRVYAKGLIERSHFLLVGREPGKVHKGMTLNLAWKDELMQKGERATMEERQRQGDTQSERVQRTEELRAGMRQMPGRGPKCLS